MTASNRWVIHQSGFPFGLPGKVIGSVVADDRRQAEALAHSVFGRQVIVDREHADDTTTFAAESLQVRAMRLMTPIEVQLARALGCLRITGPAKSTVRRMHAESFKRAPEISDQLAAKLRLIAHQHRGQLPVELLESLGGAI